MKPHILILTAGFVVFAAAYLSPSVTDPTLQSVLWSVGFLAAVAVLGAWRRARTWRPGDYA